MGSRGTWSAAPTGRSSRLPQRATDSERWEQDTVADAVHRSQAPDHDAVASGARQAVARPADFTGPDGRHQGTIDTWERETASCTTRRSQIPILRGARFSDSDHAPRSRQISTAEG